MKYEMATNSTKQVVKFSLGTCVTPPPPPLLPPLFWSIRHLQISHNAPYFPSKILQKPRSSQEKWKTNVMQNFGRQIRYITGDVVAYVLLFAPLRWLQTKYFPFFSRNVAVYETSSSGEVAWIFNVYCHVSLRVLSFTITDLRWLLRYEIVMRGYWRP